MKRVALLVETSRSYGREILSGVRQYLSEHPVGWQTSFELRDLQSPIPGWLRSWQGDGVLVRTDSAAMVQAIATLNLPTIELRSMRRHPSHPFVGMDNDAIGQMAAKHFVDLGLQNFAVYSLTVESFFVRRRDAFLVSLRQRGHDAEVFEQVGGREKPAEYLSQQRHLTKWLSSLPRPIGILACTDQLGYWLLEACRAASIRVPDEVAVMGVENDLMLCSFSDPPMSSIRLAGVEVGMQAARRLDRMMKRPAAHRVATQIRSTPKPILVPPVGIAVRQSSDWIGIDDPVVAAAIKMMRADGGVDLNVTTIAVALDCSRSTLERRFRDRLGRSPNEELIRIRINQVCEWLANSELTLQQIAERTGLSSAAYLSHRFRMPWPKPLAAIGPAMRTETRARMDRNHANLCNTVIDLKLRLI